MSDGMSDARRARGLNDIEMSGAAWLTERELADMIEEIRDLRMRTRCHCSRAAGPDGKITALCAWHDEAVTRLRGPAVRDERVAALERERDSLKDVLSGIGKQAAAASK